jgi:hypothetical protein
MKIESLPDVVELKLARDRLDGIVWRCRNLGDGKIVVLLPAMDVKLGDGRIVQLPEEAMEVAPNVEESAIVAHAEAQARESIAKIDEALKVLGVEIAGDEIAQVPPVAAAAQPEGEAVAQEAAAQEAEAQEAEEADAAESAQTGDGHAPAA